MRNGGGQKECQKKRGWPLMEGNSNERKKYHMCVVHGKEE